MNFDNIIDDFQFLDNWEDKYKYIIGVINDKKLLQFSYEFRD